MKILQVTHRYPPQVGGVETHVKEISERLVEGGHEVTVFSADAGLEGGRREVRSGVTVQRFRAFAPGDAFYLAPGIVPAVRRTEVDIVHAHNYHALPALAAAIGVRNAGFVFTTHYHGGSPSKLRDRILLPYRFIGGWAVTRSDVVVAVSEWERDRLKTDFGVKATVIPNGIDVERSAEARSEERPRRYLLCVGRLEEYKGVQYVIRALPELPEFDLVIVGGGPHRQELERVARTTGVSDRVEFVGYVEEERLPRLYVGADVFVNLSEFEAYGMTVAEALAAGTPCVVLDEKALSEWARRPDVVGVETVDAQTVADVIESAIGRDAPAESVTSWEDVVDQYETSYSTVIECR